MVVASAQMQKYFDNISKELEICYSIANTARKLNLDPEQKVDIRLARNMAERVEALIGVVAPQLIGSGVTDKIIEMEKKYAPLDWRVALLIAHEVAKQKFCKFKDQKEAIEVGIRTGFAYQTGGIVAAPLEGFIELKIKKTNDGKEYLAPFYAGPIRGAGGTAAAFSLLLVDFLRIKFGYAKYDPSPAEMSRFRTEIFDYNERVTNLQYLPSADEIDFLTKNLPIEVEGDPTEKIEVSNYKDLPRIETNMIRGGMCLVLAEGLSQKAPKLWKRLEQWGKEFGFEWEFLGEFIKLQKQIKAKKAVSQEKKEKLSPNFTFIADLVAGRPVLTHPMAKGGFRLRYGRTRTSGFSAASINPATMILLKKYIAVGTQLKIERPGKAAAMTVTDSIEGPVVKLKDGSVQRVDNVEQAKKVMLDVETILFLGDMLINYGDFSENGHVLVPCGYNEEWWVMDVEKKCVELFGTIDVDKLSSLLGLESEEIESIMKNPLFTRVSAATALLISKKLNVPLHPFYTFHWNHITHDELKFLLNYWKNPHFVKEQKENDELIKIVVKHDDTIKKNFEFIGCPHQFVNKEFMIFNKQYGLILNYLLSDNASINTSAGTIQPTTISHIITPHTFEIDKNKSIIENLTLLSGIILKDKSGTFIGARMGRPEKAKMRKMTGSPQVLFPVGEEGGKTRSFQSALESGKVTADFPIFMCPKCEKETIYKVCETCKNQTKQMYFCKACGKTDKQKCPSCKNEEMFKHQKQTIDIKYYFDSALSIFGEKAYPDLIKGVKGTSNKNHIPEHLVKGMLRAKHNLYVNKDGTIRYDMSELPITHFKPAEVGSDINKLKELGYDKDIHGKELFDSEQVLELKPQDLILPGGTEAMEEPATKILFRTGNFIDELLVKYYSTKPYYNFKTESDLVGHLVIALAPHISAGMVARIIGFSKTQGMFAHPLFHASLRRDCLTYDTMIPILNNNQWKMEKIGSFVESLNPTQQIDNFGTLGQKLDKDNYYTLSFDKEIHQITVSKINEITKHKPSITKIITTENGRTIEATPTHIFYVKEDNKTVEKRANQLNKGNLLMIPYNFSCVTSTNIPPIFIPDIYKEKDLMVSNITPLIKKKINSKRQAFCKKYNLKAHELNNYLFRENWPSTLVKSILNKIPTTSFVSIKRDTVKLPAKLSLTNNVLWLIGLYIAEGCSRKNTSKKGYYQVSFAATETFIRDKIKKTCKKYFNLTPSRETKDALIYSSKLFYLFFTDFLPCGSIAHEKRIPQQLLALNLKKLKYLLRGYFDGDGSTDTNELRVSCDTVSKQLIEDMYFVLSRYGIYFKKYESTRFPGKTIQEFYIKKCRDIPKFTSTKLTILSDYCGLFAENINFSLPRKQKILLKNLKIRKITGTKIVHDNHFAYLKIISINSSKKPKTTYCLNVNKTHNFIANNFIVHNCDGDEASVSLLLDGLLNFSTQFLPDSRGAKTMDAPLVLTSLLNPAEVDDQAHGLDVTWQYPLELYEAAEQYKNPWDVKIEQIKHRLGQETQYEQVGYTHPVSSINEGVLFSAYKSLPSMEEKLNGQMEIARMVRAVDEANVAELVITKHFIKDTKGNLRKFSQQQFRCVKCNEKFRRPPLRGICTKCGGKLIFTISEGSVLKYLDLSIKLSKDFNVSVFTRQSLDLLKNRIDSVFGKEKEKQEGLGKWF